MIQTNTFLNSCRKTLNDVNRLKKGTSGEIWLLHTTNYYQKNKKKKTSLLHFNFLCLMLIGC